MGFSCAPQLMGLVRGEPKSGQKHRANAKAICAEAGEERVSKSVTLDRTRSHLNIYDGFTKSGFALADEMERQANEYTTTFTDKNGVVRKRKLKADAVCGYAVIFNPPEEECSSWTNAQYQKFYDDSWSCLCEIEPRLFDDKNILMSAEHFDEGFDETDRHLHKLGIPKDLDGKYCGNLLDAKLLSTINQKYPAMMRQHGWDMDDLDVTDWDRYKIDSDYRMERKKKFRDNGKSTNKYIQDKIEQELQKQQKNTTNTEENLAVADRLRSEAEEEKRKNEADAKAILKKSMELKKRESAISAKEQEQQKKDDEFQHKEDALEAQRKVLDERDSQQNKRERALQPQEHFQDVNNRANTTSSHRFDEYGNRI